MLPAFLIVKGDFIASRREDARLLLIVVGHHIGMQRVRHRRDDHRLIGVAVDKRQQYLCAFQQRKMHAVTAARIRRCHAHPGGTVIGCLVGYIERQLHLVFAAFVDFRIFAAPLRIDEGSQRAFYSRPWVRNFGPELHIR
jgi:hypothetical protein